MCFLDSDPFQEGSVPFFVRDFPLCFSILSVFKNVPSEFITYLSGLRASSGTVARISARDKERYAVRAALALRLAAVTMHIKQT